MTSRLMMFLFLFMPAFCFSQPAQKYIHYDINDGLSANTVYTAIQDSCGFMWFSTSKGITRFDGYQFVKFSPIPALADAEILKIFFEDDSKTWLIPYGNGAYCVREDTAERIKASLLDSLFIISMAFSGDTVWFGSYNNGVVGYDFKQQLEITIKKEQLGSKLGTVALDGQGRLFIGTETGICAWNGGMLQCTQFPDSFFLKGEDISLKFMKDRRLIACTKSHILEIESDTFKTIFAWRQIDPQLRIHSMNEDASGNFLVATNKGALKLEYKNGRYHPVRYLSDQHVNMFYEDSEGNYWFTTAHRGIYFLGRLMRHIFTVKESSGVPLGNIHFLKSLEGVYGNILAGNSEGHLFLMDENSVSTIELLSQDGMMLYDVAESNGIIYTATSHGLFINRIESLLSGKVPLKYPPLGALSQYTGDTVRTYAMAGDFNYIRWNSPRTLEIDSSGQLWFGANSGITRVVHEEDYYSFTRFNNERTFRIKIDGSGKVFAATLSGLGILRENGSIDYGLPVNSEITSKISHFDFDENNNLWVSTLGQGLFSFGHDTVLNYTDKNILQSNRINHFQISHGQMYLAYSREVDRFQIAPTSTIVPGSVKRFDLSSPLGSDEINKIFHQDSNIYLATSTGIMLLNEYEDVEVESPPILNIQAIEVGNQLFKKPGRFEVPYRTARFKVAYTGISFGSFRNISFRYKLEGIDDMWTETRERTVEYPQLPPGSYAFLLSAKTAGSKWVPPVRIQLEVSPPFWRTTWFILFAVIIFVGTTAAVARWRVGRVRKRARERITLNKRMAEYKLKALQAQMNPHFISNALTSIQRYVSISDGEKASAYLGKFSRLMRYVLESSINNKITLDEEIKLLSLYLELEMLRFGGKGKYYIHCAPDVVPEEIELPTMLLQPFVENAIIHSIQPKGNGTVSVSFVLKENNLICEVTDEGNGSGTAPEIRDSEKFPSRSTELINQKLETIRQMENMDIEISISKLAANTGTKVKIIIPIA